MAIQILKKNSLLPRTRYIVCPFWGDPHQNGACSLVSLRNPQTKRGDTSKRPTPREPPGKSSQAPPREIWHSRSPIEKPRLSRETNGTGWWWGCGLNMTKATQHWRKTGRGGEIHHPLLCEGCVGGGGVGGGEGGVAGRTSRVYVAVGGMDI